MMIRPAFCSLVTFTALANTVTALANTVFAHPGHGVTDPDTVTHHVIEPMHAVPWGMLAMAMITGLAFWLRHRSKKAESVEPARTTHRR